MKLDTLSEWADLTGVIGFFITIISLGITINIKRILSKMKDVTQYYRERMDYCDALHKSIQKFASLNEIGAIISEITIVNGIIQQIIAFNVWKPEHKKVIQLFHDFSKDTLNELINCLDPDDSGISAVGMTPQNLLHYTTSYSSRLNEVYSIVRKDSSVSS